MGPGIPQQNLRKKQGIDFRNLRKTDSFSRRQFGMIWKLRTTRLNSILTAFLAVVFFRVRIYTGTLSKFAGELEKSATLYASVIFDFPVQWKKLPQFEINFLDYMPVVCTLFRSVQWTYVSFRPNMSLIVDYLLVTQVPLSLLLMPN